MLHLAYTPENDIERMLYGEADSFLAEFECRHDAHGREHTHVDSFRELFEHDAGHGGGGSSQHGMWRWEEEYSADGYGEQAEQAREEREKQEQARQERERREQARQESEWEDDSRDQERRRVARARAEAQKQFEGLQDEQTASIDQEERGGLVGEASAAQREADSMATQAEDRENQRWRDADEEEADGTPLEAVAATKQAADPRRKRIENVIQSRGKAQGLSDEEIGDVLTRFRYAADHRTEELGGFAALLDDDDYESAAETGGARHESQTSEETTPAGQETHFEGEERPARATKGAAAAASVSQETADESLENAGATAQGSADGRSRGKAEAESARAEVAETSQEGDYRALLGLTTEGAPTETGDGAPTETGDGAPTETGDGAPTETGDGAPTETGDGAPTETGDGAPTETGDGAPKTGDGAPTETGDGAPTETGDGAPTETGDGAPTETGDGAPKPAGPRVNPAYEEWMTTSGRPQYLLPDGTAPKIDWGKWMPAKQTPVEYAATLGIELVSNPDFVPYSVRGDKPPQYLRANGQPIPETFEQAVAIYQADGEKLGSDLVAYKTESDAFRTDASAYATAVEEWNKTPGTPEQLKELGEWRERLLAEQGRLSESGTEIKSRAAERTKTYDWLKGLEDQTPSHRNQMLRAAAQATALASAESTYTTAEFEQERTTYDELQQAHDAAKQKLDEASAAMQTHWEERRGWSWAQRQWRRGTTDSLQDKQRQASQVYRATLQSLTQRGDEWAEAQARQEATERGESALMVDLRGRLAAARVKSRVAAAAADYDDDNMPNNWHSLHWQARSRNDEIRKLAAMIRDAERGDGQSTELGKVFQALQERAEWEQYVDDNDDDGGGGGGGGDDDDDDRDYSVAGDGTVSYTQGDHSYTVSDESLAQDVRDALESGDAGNLTGTDATVTVSDGEGNTVSNQEGPDGGDDGDGDGAAAATGPRTAQTLTEVIADTIASEDVSSVTIGGVIVSKDSNGYTTVRNGDMAVTYGDDGEVISTTKSDGDGGYRDIEEGDTPAIETARYAGLLVSPADLQQASATYTIDPAAPTQTAPTLRNYAHLLNVEVSWFQDQLANLPADPAAAAARLEELAATAEENAAKWDSANLGDLTFTDGQGRSVDLGTFYRNEAARYNESATGIKDTLEATGDFTEGVDLANSPFTREDQASDPLEVDTRSFPNLREAVGSLGFTAEQYRKLAEEWKNRPDNHLVQIPVGDAELGQTVTPAEWFANQAALLEGQQGTTQGQLDTAVAEREAFDRAVAELRSDTAGAGAAFNQQEQASDPLETPNRDFTAGFDEASGNLRYTADRYKELADKWEGKPENSQLTIPVEGTPTVIDEEGTFGTIPGAVQYLTPAEYYRQQADRFDADAARIDAQAAQAKDQALANLAITGGGAPATAFDLPGGGSTAQPPEYNYRTGGATAMDAPDGTSTSEMTLDQYTAGLRATREYERQLRSQIPTGDPNQQYGVGGDMYDMAAAGIERPTWNGVPLNYVDGNLQPVDSEGQAAFRVGYDAAGSPVLMRPLRDSSGAIVRWESTGSNPEQRWGLSDQSKGLQAAIDRAGGYTVDTNGNVLLPSNQHVEGLTRGDVDPRLQTGSSNPQAARARANRAAQSFQQAVPPQYINGVNPDGSLSLRDGWQDHVVPLHPDHQQITGVDDKGKVASDGSFTHNARPWLSIVPGARTAFTAYDVTHPGSAGGTDLTGQEKRDLAKDAFVDSSYIFGWPFAGIGAVRAGGVGLLRSGVGPGGRALAGGRGLVGGLTPKKLLWDSSLPRVSRIVAGQHRNAIGNLRRAPGATLRGSGKPFRRETVAEFGEEFVVEAPIEILAPHLFKSSDRQPLWTKDRTVRENVFEGGIFPNMMTPAIMAGSSVYFGGAAGLGSRRFRRSGTPSIPTQDQLLVPDDTLPPPPPPAGNGDPNGPAYFSGGDPYYGGYVSDIPESLRGSPLSEGDPLFRSQFPGQDFYTGDPSDYQGPYPLPGIYSPTPSGMTRRPSGLYTPTGDPTPIAHGRPDADAHGRPDAAHGRPDADAHGRPDADAHGRPDADAHGRPDAIAHGRPDTDAHAVAIVDTDTHAHAHAHAHADADTDDNTKNGRPAGHNAAGPVHRRTGIWRSHANGHTRSERAGAGDTRPHRAGAGDTRPHDTGPANTNDRHHYRRSSAGAADPRARRSHPHRRRLHQG